MVLADTTEIKLPLDFRGFGHPATRLVFACLPAQFLVQHLFAQYNAIVADINARARNQFFDFSVRLPEEAAHRDILWPSHISYSFLSARLVARSARPGISLRDWTTSSTSP